MQKVIVVGAGLVGSLWSVFLAKKGYKVEVYERRPDMRKQGISSGRSINLALSDRGWKALDKVGAGDEIRKISIPMYGRKMHSIEGELTYQQYGKEDQAIYSVSRGGLNSRLMGIAEQHENVTYHFDHKCLDVDLEKAEVAFEDQQSGQTVHVSADRIFGTDGAFSAVRGALQKTDRFNYSQQYLEHGYKELLMPADANGEWKLDKHALHIWPRGEYMLIALANLDGSFTCTLFFPFEGKRSFSSINTKEDVNGFFTEVFPDFVPLMPNLEEEYFSNPTSSLVTVRCSPWNYKDKVVVFGDAAHAIVPFYGQGMNAGFEDCTILSELMEKHDEDWMTIFNEFSKIRKPDADAIADLAIRNFIEMRDLTADPRFLLQKKIEKKIYEKFPEKWVPLYSRVTFTHQPYSQALAKGVEQDRIMEKIMDRPGLEQNWDSDEIEQEILQMISDTLF